MKKVLVVILFMSFFTVNYGQNRVDVVPYFMPISYTNSIYRESGSISGFYTYWELGLNHAVETGVDYGHYIFTGDIRVDQWDLSFAYNNYSIPEWVFRGGLHYISSDDISTNKSFVAFAGIEKYVFNSWNISLDAYYSNYDNYTPKFNSIQFVPKLGLTFPTGMLSGIYVEGRGYIIHLTKNLSFGKRNFFSGEGAVSYYNEDFTLKVFGWIGKQAFAVKSNGFLVYNVEELFKSGLGGSLKLNLSSNTNITFGAQLDNFTDIADTNQAKSIKYMFIFGISL